MKKFILISLLLSSLIWFVLLKFATNQIYSKIDPIKELVGKKVIWKTDTLMIIDYSIINDTYTLETGISLNMTLVETLKFIENE